jgi:acyl carrier protein
VSVSWDGWLAQQGSAGASLQTSLDRYAMTADESLRAFERATSLESHGHTIVSTGDLHVRVKHWIGERGRVATRPASFGADSGAVTGAAAADTAGPKATCVPPTTEVEQDVLTIWQELLGLAPIGIHDNFFELGGSSLLGLKMISRIKRACGIDLPIVAIFEAPTVHLLAKRIEHGRNEPAHGRESLERGERRRARRAEALAEARRA